MHNVLAARLCAELLEETLAPGDKLGGIEDMTSFIL